jgi:hypothetical protein
MADRREIAKLKRLTAPPPDRTTYRGFLETGQAIAKYVRLGRFPNAIVAVETNRVLRVRLHTPACGFVSPLALLTAQPGERHPTTGRGVVTGVIWFEGGVCPIPGCGPKGGQVTVFRPSGRVVAQQRVHWPRPFSFILRPGRYELNVGGRMRYDYPMNCRPGRVLVRRGQTVAVDVQTGCGIP